MGQVDTMVGILHLQTPSGFLDELARQLKARYEIEVMVVEGEKQGLLIKRERKSDDDF